MSAARISESPRLGVESPANAERESIGVALGSRDKLRVLLLSGVAGYVDSAAFLSVIGLFPAHITGELVGEALALSSPEHPLASHSRLWMLPVFVLSVAIAAVVARFKRKSNKAPMAALLLLVSIALGSFAACGAVLLLMPNHDHSHFTLLSGCFAVAAMGFQNALMRESLKGSSPTTFMTGNLTQLVIEIVDLLFGRRPAPGEPVDAEREVSKARFRMTSTALAAFLSSAIVGGWLTRSVGSVSAILPMVLVSLMSLHAFREQRSRAIWTEPARTTGMRQPTPIHRRLEKPKRPHSGTRMKAVRPPEEPGQESA